MSAHVNPVTISTRGLSFTLDLEIPFGDNPTFYALQVERQLAEAATRARTILEAVYGEQRTEESSEAGEGERAWDAGWLAHVRQEELQQEDPHHRITCNNPYRRQA